MAKLDNKKLLACCANGAGSSLMMEKAIDKVMKKYNIKPAELRHCPVSEGKTAARNYDVVFCARTFVKTFDGIEKDGTVLMHYMGYIGVAIVVVVLLAIPQIEYKMDPEGYFLITEDYDAYVEHVAAKNAK